MVGDLTRDGFLVTPKIDSLTVEGAKKSRPIDSGTVVMAVSGNVGLVSRLAIDACVHDGFVAFKDLDESAVRPEFFLWQLHLAKALHQQNTAGAIFQNLTTTGIKALRIIVPDMSSQDKFVARAVKTTAFELRVRESASKLDDLLASLQQRAFRGEL